jgi:hypothetical protein
MSCPPRRLRRGPNRGEGPSPTGPSPPPPGEAPHSDRARARRSPRRACARSDARAWRQARFDPEPDTATVGAKAETPRRAPVASTTSAPRPADPEPRTDAAGDLTTASQEGNRHPQRALVQSRRPNSTGGRRGMNHRLPNNRQRPVSTDPNRSVPPRRAASITSAAATRVFLATLAVLAATATTAIGAPSTQAAGVKGVKTLVWLESGLEWALERIARCSCPSPTARSARCCGC